MEPPGVRLDLDRMGPTDRSGQSEWSELIEQSHWPERDRRRDIWAISRMLAVYQPRKVTVTWQCKCGTIITDQYTKFEEGAVQAYLDKRQLRYKIVTKAQDNSPKSQGWSGSVRSMLNSFLKLNIIPLNRKQTPSQGTENPSAIQNDSAESQPDSRSNKPPTYLQLCISRHRRYTRTTHTTHSLKLEADKELYDLLRAQYAELTGRWKRFFLLRHINQIRFVRFRLRTNKEVEINAHSKMENCHSDACPPPNHLEYEFTLPDPTVLPPVGHNEMMYYFYQSCLGQFEDFHFRHFPGHKSNPVPFQPNEEVKHVWGLELVESENRKWLYLSVPIFILFVSSMIFGISWTVARNDIQGGFTVAGYMVASGLALLGSIQVFIEDV